MHSPQRPDSSIDDPLIIGSWTIVNGDYPLTREFRADGTFVSHAYGFDDIPRPFRISGGYVIFSVEQPDGTIHEQKERFELTGDTLRFFDDDDDDGSIRIFIRDSLT